MQTDFFLLDPHVQVGSTWMRPKSRIHGAPRASSIHACTSVKENSAILYRIQETESQPVKILPAVSCHVQFGIIPNSTSCVLMETCRKIMLLFFFAYRMAHRYTAHKVAVFQNAFAPKIGKLTLCPKGA